MPRPSGGSYVLYSHNHRKGGRLSLLHAVDAVISCYPMPAEGFSTVFTCQGSRRSVRLYRHLSLPRGLPRSRFIKISNQSTTTQPTYGRWSASSSLARPGGRVFGRSRIITRNIPRRRCSSAGRGGCLCADGFRW